jgi:hypothetical protein
MYSQENKVERIAKRIVAEPPAGFDECQRACVRGLLAKSRSKRALLRKELQEAVDAVRFMEIHVDGENEYNTVRCLQHKVIHEHLRILGEFSKAMLNK